VPVYNSAADLEHCLAALAASDFEDFDVLVVDDGSTESIQPLVAARGFDYVRIQGPGGPARARNHGVALVEGDYVVFIDADVCVHPATLSRIAAGFTSDPDLDAIIGSYDEAPAKPNFLSQYKNLFHHYVHQQSDGVIGTFWSGCGAIRRELFLTFGGFDEHRYRRPAIEDIELGTWLTAAGHKIVLNSQIKVKHLKRWTLWNLLKTDIFDRGIPWTRLMLRAGGLASTLNVKPSQRVSVGLAYLALFSFVAALYSPYFLALTFVLVVVVTVLNWDFYQFFMSHSGLWFALRVLPLHWLYFFYCGFSFAWGTLMHHVSGDAGPRLTELKERADAPRP
jgi:glycosyltransferase involved in cell wall biosynthesis